MAVPKRRTSKSKRDSRRATYLRMTAPSLSTCPQCNEPKLPHRVCSHCGFYKGREIQKIEL